MGEKSEKMLPSKGGIAHQGPSMMLRRGLKEGQGSQTVFTSLLTGAGSSFPEREWEAECLGTERRRANS